MADATAFQQLSASGAAQTDTEVDLTRLGEIPMELSVEIGRTHMTVAEVLALHIGAIVALERTAGESADLLVNGTPIARGEVVVVEERFGLRITEITEGPQMAAGADEGAVVEAAAAEGADAEQEIDSTQPAVAQGSGGEALEAQGAERIAA